MVRRKGHILIDVLGKGSKIKLIIFVDFSAKITNFLKCSENVQNALKHEIKQ